MMLRHPGLVINGVWRDVLWGHHRALYRLPLASCQFIPYLFLELMFIDSSHSHSLTTQMRGGQTKASAGGQDIGWLKGLQSDSASHPRSLVELVPADLYYMSCVTSRLRIQVLLLYKPSSRPGCS